MSSKTELTFEIILLGAEFEEDLYVKPKRFEAGQEVTGHELGVDTGHFLYVNLK
jgi:hypothetical protein